MLSLAQIVSLIVFQPQSPSVPTSDKHREMNSPPKFSKQTQEKKLPNLNQKIQISRTIIFPINFIFRNRIDLKILEKFHREYWYSV